MNRLYTLGAIDLQAGDGRSVEPVLTQPKRTALLAYLAVARPRGFHRRDTLLALFWPELDHAGARHALRQSVYVLRRGLGEDVVRGRGAEELAVDGSRMWCDAVALEEALEASRLAEALEIYRGEFLAGFHVRTAGLELEEWIVRERRRQREGAFQAVRSLARGADALDDVAAAVGWLRRALVLAPDDEDTLRELLVRLERLGDRRAAVHAYEEFASRLERELEVEPAEETQRLIARLRARPAAAEAVAASRDAATRQGLRSAGSELPRRTRSSRARRSRPACEW